MPPDGQRVWAARTPVASVDSLRELFGALLAGEALAFPLDAGPGAGPDAGANVVAEAAFWSRAGVSSVITVPSVARLLAADLPPGAGQLRDWVLTGETLPGSLVTAMLEALPGCRLYNVYGCTEAPGWGTLLLPGDAGTGSAPVGTPLAGATLELRGPDGGPVADGETGEVWLGGPGVGWGYHGDPQATATAFVPDESVPGGLWFRTGDLAVRREGRVWLAGRRDRRVKLLGNFVDLDEVEAVAADLPGVLEAAVEPAGGELPTALRAWIVPAPGHASRLLPRHVTEHLQQALGRHVVASPVRLVGELPRLSFGKVDRAALRSLREGDGSQRAGEAPRSEIERALAAIWADVLGVPAVFADDDFFGIGGNSLQAARVIGRVRRDMRIGLPVSVMFTARTVRALGEVASTARRAPDAPREASDDGTLTNEQKRLWLLDLATTGSTAHVISACAPVTPAVPLADVEAAIRAVAARHPAMRSRFSLRAPGDPTFILGEAADLPFAHVDLSRAGRRAVDAHVARFARRPIPLVHDGPLFRAEYLTGPGGDRRLLLAFHHMVIDAESFRIIRDELLRALSGTALPARHVLPTRTSGAPRPGLPSALSAELRETRSAIAISVRGGTGDRASLATQRDVIPLGQQRIDSLGARAAELSTTVFTLLLAALSVVVSRHSGERAFAVATPVSFRDDPAVAGEVGFFLNTTAIPCQVRPADTLASLADRLHAATGRFLDGRDVPFEDLVSGAGAPRAFGVSPLAQVMLVADVPVTAPAPDDRIGAFVGLDRGMGTFDLVVSYEERARRIVVDTRTAAVSAADARVLADHLDATVTALCETSADCPIDDIPIHSPGEQEQLITWARQVPRRAATAAAARIAAAMASCSERRAVVSGPSAWTYGDLASAAEHLRDLMRQRNLGTGDRIAIVDEHPLVTVAAVVASLFEGCVFVPVDPQAPVGRVRAMLERANAGLTITGDALAGVTCSRRAARPPRDVPGQAPAYIVFTSGTTGEPKGVELPRDGLDQFVAGYCDDIGVCADSRVLQAVSFGFDPWILNTMLALAHGAELHMRPGTVAPFGSGLARLLNESRATHAFITTAAFETVRPEWVAVKDLTVMVGGSICGAELANRWLGRLTLYNLYGPSEATVLSTGKRCDGGRPSVGRPFPGESVQVCDERGRLCPVGVPGELLIGGAGVGIGYIGMPRLTALQFRPDPLAAEPGGRVYGSGDRGCLLPDGEIYFIGRADRQRKVRGYRLELDEIAAIVAAFPGVTAVAVDVRPNDILSCCVASPGLRVTAETVRADLAGRLPAWAVPNHIKVVERMPLNLNGKVDWNAIDRIPAARRPAAGDDPAGAADELSGAVAAAWEAALGHRAFGLRDNFFDVGGHSLLLPVLHERLQQDVTGVTLMDLFRYPTVESLAGYLRRRGAPVVPGAAAPDPAAPSPAAGRRARISQVRRMRDANARGGSPDA